MKLLKYITLAFILVLNIGCDDFLDERPSKSTSVVPETIEQLEALLNDYDSFYREYSRELLYSTDDYGFYTEIYDNLSSAYTAQHLAYGTWNAELIENMTSILYWPAEWKKVFTANMVLQNLGSVSGSEEKKAQLRAECHFIRAYSYFKMATIYCLPYSEDTKEELGLPLKQSTSFEESVSRASLQETYDFIESDLIKALELKHSFSQVNDFNETWRANTAAVNGFAARFYLGMNDYENSLLYSDKALQEYDVLRNYNTDMRFSDIPNEVTIFNPNPTQVTIDYPYTHDQQVAIQDRLEFGEFYYYRMFYNGAYNYYPSLELLNLYDKTYDLRYKYHIVEDYTYDRGAVNPPYSYPGYIFFFKTEIPSGPSVSEMLLTKGECQIRLGAFEEGLNTVNILRNARMDVNAPAEIKNLNAANQSEALNKVLQERRRELPFVHRWFDIRRYNSNDNPSDDVTITRTFYPYNASAILKNESPIIYTLEPNSRHYAFPIPMTDIIASEGVLQQNEY